MTELQEESIAYMQLQEMLDSDLFIHVVKNSSGQYHMSIIFDGANIKHTTHIELDVAIDSMYTFCAKQGYLK